MCYRRLFVVVHSAVSPTAAPPTARNRIIIFLFKHSLVLMVRLYYAIFFANALSCVRA